MLFVEMEQVMGPLTDTATFSAKTSVVFLSPLTKSLLTRFLWVSKGSIKRQQLLIASHMLQHLAMRVLVHLPTTLDQRQEWGQALIHLLGHVNLKLMSKWFFITRMEKNFMGPYAGVG